MWDAFILLPRCGLLLLIFFAPAAMGSIPDWAETILVLGSYAVAGFHLFDFTSRRGWNGLPRLPLLLGALLLLQGWLMAANAKYIYVPELMRLLPLPARLNSLPGTFDHDATIQWMTRLTAFFAIFVMILDLSRDPAWRRRILLTMGLTGIGLIGFGLSEKTTHWMGLWPQYGHNVWPFATYYYHGNAGAFINLVFPLIAAFTTRSFFFDTHPWWRSLWTFGLALTIAGAFVNASKAAQAIFLLLLLLSLLPLLRLLRSRLLTPAFLLRSLIVLPVFFAAVAAVLYFGDLGQAFARWLLALEHTALISSGRIGVATVCLRLSHYGGFFGFGPGSFTTLFPYATWPEGRSLAGFWRYAHNDYLQTIVEWGWAGATLWGLFFLGGIFSAFFITMRPPRKLRLRTRLLLGAGGCSLFGCAAHALADFPLQIPSLEFYAFILLALSWGAWSWPAEGDRHR